MPDDPSYLWSRARRMQPPAAPPNRLPTVEEMHFLRHVAASVCAVPDDSPKVMHLKSPSAAEGVEGGKGRNYLGFSSDVQEVSPTSLYHKRPASSA